MTLSAWFTKHKGTSILIPGGGAGNNGQCVQAADSALNEVYGQPYVYTPAALDFWTKFDSFPQLKNNFVKVAKGKPVNAGDFVIYDQRVGAKQGHIDIASRNGTAGNFYAYDSNWGGVKDPKTGYPILHEVHHADVYNNYIVGYLRKKGATVTPQQKADLALGEKARTAGWQPRLEQLKTATIEAVIAFKVDPDFVAKVKKIVG